MSNSQTLHPIQYFNEVDRTHVPNLHIIMRRRLLGQMMAVTLRQISASTSSILIWG
jgi:hypothetical protein